MVAIRKDIRQIGMRLHNERKQRGWTLHELSDRTGISVSHISAIERGERDFTISCLLLLLDAYKITPNALLLDQLTSQSVETYKMESLANECAEYIKKTLVKYQT